MSHGSYAILPPRPHCEINRVTNDMRWPYEISSGAIFTANGNYK